MQKVPTISITTPSFNQVDYIRQTIESVISQEGDFYIDYIIMDGGSSDQSVSILREYERLISSGEWPIKCQGLQYRWNSEPDRGQSHAINKGWSVASGDLLAWINSDDYYTPGAFARAVEAFADDDSLIMIYGDLNVIDTNGHSMLFQKLKDFNYLSLLYQRIGISQPGSFIRRDVTNLIGYLDEGLHCVMDLDYWLRLGLVGLIKYVPFAFARYRVHAQAKSSSFPKLWQNEMLQILSKLFKSSSQFTVGQRLRAYAETYRYTASFFLPFKDRLALLRSCLFAATLYPPLLWNSDLYGYWVYGIFGFRLGDKLKRLKRTTFGKNNDIFMKIGC